MAAILGLLWRASRLAGAAGADSELARGMAREVASAGWEALSIGLGAYVLIAATGFLACQAYKPRT